jgi:hypothetical protein
LAASLLALVGCAGKQCCLKPAGGGTPIDTTGVIGSPDATTTISGRQLPAPDPKFDGVIGPRAQRHRRHEQGCG